ncbi:DUF262 domain-containing protein [Aliarcobacter cryaerophilus]|uniref:DUF262 domain-containing protein n=1 Tax=Aliarcobacter cryaerophilus TaxID=28198 RepID=UPI0021B4EF42|nr:DUF262 domain-containing protein [Aliarcobacter cryaerophilus]MCT7520942.1 DUF262 domain-containing protein [Aliarcobacter cryaerophilus]
MSEVLENPKLKSIYELLCNEEGKPESFFIPSYQRGYRWTEQQVKELLQDIWEFATKSKKEEGEFYCLQPIVVKRNKKDNTKWDVIDGQQRLTTIYIILKVLEDRIESDSKNFDLDYETRPKSKEFLENEIFQENIENIDFFHMNKSYETIISWFKNKANKGFPTVKSEFIIPLLGKVKVIWYEVEEDETQTEEENNKKDIEVFTRINMGKIPLTNAELIKALLIQGYKDNDNKNNKQFELASEWDFIEYSLQNDDFWYFINKEKNEKATRIEFIFELISKKYSEDNKEKFPELIDLDKSKSIDRYYEFHIINHYLKEENQTPEIYKKLWSEVKNYFRILNEWYEDREFFHKIGFLIIYSKKTMLDFIAEYTKENSTKKEFRDFLDKEIKEIFENIEIEELNYEKDKESIRKILLWFNISTIIQNEETNLRFQFDRYKKQNWDIEHIRSQADKYPNKKEEKEAWIDDILKLPNIEKTKDIILKMEKKEFNEFFDDIQNKIEGEDNDFNKHSIGNLTLLDSSTNRAYGNAFFTIKRKTIIENDMNGTFIPICTKNLFLKYYSENATDLQKWIKEDAEDYKSAILETFEELKNGAKNEKQ